MLKAKPKFKPGVVRAQYPVQTYGVMSLSPVLIAGAVAIVTAPRTGLQYHAMAIDTSGMKGRKLTAPKQAKVTGQSLLADYVGEVWG